MTLSARNSIFKVGIIISSLSLALCAVASLKAIPVYALMEGEATRRSAGIFQAFFGLFFDARLLAVHCCVLALVAYSVLTIVLTYYSFEKTQSPEVLFVVFFAASFSPEALRLILPLAQVYEIPLLYTLMASRIILFARNFGIFSLFIASVFAAGYEVQRQRNVVMLIVVTALIIAIGVPIDTQSWDSSLNMITGYAPMFRLIETGTFFITAISFFIAAWSRGSREFIFIGAGSVLALLGRAILLSADTWASLPVALAFLVAGTWLVCTYLHKIYLWL
ncbi:MAG: hypothetical protein LBQ69_06315 [Treponema sp.]|jgi:hypothetical protein|nr:hypothetical protein [Treponema sp.]